MIVSGDQDPYGAAAPARTLHDWTNRTSELLILPSDRHGTEILTRGGPNTEKLTAALINFIRRVSAGSAATC
jgi:hypothetical protein